MRMSLLMTALLTAAAGPVLAVVPADARVPQSAVCGGRYAAGVVLAAALTCAGDGVVLTGNGTFDLRGHTLVATAGTAVRVADGPFAVTVRHGHISRSVEGVALAAIDPDGAAYRRVLTVADVTFAGDTTAVNTSIPGASYDTRRITDVTIDRASFVRNGQGVSGLFTGSVDISSSTFSMNSRAVHIDTGRVAINRSVFSRNAAAVTCVEADCTVLHNVFRQITDAVSSQTGPVVLTGNVISGSRTAVRGLGAYRPSISLNVFTDNETAVDLGAGDAPGMVARNLFADNGVGYTSSGGVAATLTRNLFLRNVDGVDVPDPGTPLGANVALRNKHYGLYAPGAVDLGANVAAGNGYSPQCTGVRCAVPAGQSAAPAADRPVSRRAA